MSRSPNIIASANKSIDAWLPKGSAPQLADIPQWFAEQRAQALMNYKSTDLPEASDEEWRYTKLRALKAGDFCFASSAGAAAAPEPSENPRLVFVDGYFSEGLSNTSGLQEGIIFCDLGSALINYPDELSKIVGSTLPPVQHGFGLMNSAFVTSGYVFIVRKNVSLANPVEAVFLHSEITNNSAPASHIRNVVLAEVHSNVKVVERHMSMHAGTYLSNCVTEVIARDGAKVDHYKIQQESENAFHVGAVYAHQNRDSLVKSHNICLDGKLIRNDIQVQLLGEGAHNELNGLVLGSAQQHIDNFTEVNHAVPRCTSDEFYKTVLDERSRSVFRGRIIVAQDAQLTSADQQNNNLLLSSRAEADTKPQLEIYADDVKCSHGATVGQLDKKSLFYLQSRGISPDDARALLTFAFANEVVARIDIDSIKAEISNLIAGELVRSLESVL